MAAESRTQEGPAATRELLTLFTLGIFVGCAFCMLLIMRGSLPAYLFFLSLFHALEYLATRIYQPSRASFDSFLLNHSSEYTASVLATVAEYAVESWAAPRLKGWLCALRWLGFCLAVAGQTLRTVAMVEAKDAFSHLIAEKREPGHRLVTTGIYRHARHPSYLGFLLWTVGIQLVMGNPVCLAAFARVLLRFFRERIEYEEGTLLSFFPKDFPAYRAAVWSGFYGIP